MEHTLKMVDLDRQYQALKPEIDAAIAGVISSGAFIAGPPVAAFESALADFLGAPHVISCASGTDALQIAFMALGIGEGDEVITTPFSFVAAVEALVLLGAKPVFADIDPVTFNLNPAEVEACITPRTRAIVPVHLYGHPAGMDGFVAIGRKHGLPVIEDAAQAIGATYKGKAIATLGEIACLSFFPAKNLGCFGDGGALVVRSAELAARCRMIANHGARVRYQHELVGINSRLDTIQAAVLGVKLPHLRAFNDGRRRVAQAYDRLLSGLDLQTPQISPLVEHVYQQYTIRTPRRDALAAFLRDRAVPSAIHYPVPLHKQPAFELLLPPGAVFPEAERAAAEVLSLPIFPEVTDGEIEQVASAVRAFFA